MPIEYAPGIQQGQKIDLSRFEKTKRGERPKRPEEYLPVLKERLSDQAREINADFGDFLTPEAQIKMVGRDALSDTALVEQQEDGYAMESGRTREAWLAAKEANPASLTELSLTLLFHKFLKDDFIVARASAYDDYNNGVDTVIIDKRTGALVCGFDEVITQFKDGSSQKKADKLARKMQAGGARIKYGAFVEDGILRRASRSNLPAFYISLTKEELEKLLPELAEEKSSSASAAIFARLASSLESQFGDLDQAEDLHPYLKDNIAKFRSSLSKIKSGGQAFNLAA